MGLVLDTFLWRCSCFPASTWPWSRHKTQTRAWRKSWWLRPAALPWALAQSREPGPGNCSGTHKHSSETTDGSKINGGLSELLFKLRHSETVELLFFFWNWVLLSFIKKNWKKNCHTIISICRLYNKLHSKPFLYSHQLVGSFCVFLSRCKDTEINSSVTVRTVYFKWQIA